VPDEIAGLATLVGVGRDGVDPDHLVPVDLGSGRGLEFQSLDVTRVDISSSEVRARVGNGRSIQYLVPEAVARIIETHRLYRSIP